MTAVRAYEDRVRVVKRVHPSSPVYVESDNNADCRGQKSQPSKSHTEH